MAGIKIFMPYYYVLLAYMWYGVIFCEPPLRGLPAYPHSAPCIWADSEFLEAPVNVECALASCSEFMGRGIFRLPINSDR